MKLTRNLPQFLIFGFLIVMGCFVMVACQKPTVEIVHESKEPIKTEQAKPDFNQICQNLKQDMLAMNAQRTTLALEQVNQDIRMCLPQMQFDEQISLMKLSEKMYQQFLQINRTASQQLAFESYVLDQDIYPTIQQTQFEKLNIRDQYLLRHKGQAYVELVELSSGNNRAHPNIQMSYRRSPQYLAKVFAPYLPEAERIFIENLAVQNSEALFKENKLNIEAEETAHRAKFWQDYVQNYPNSRYIADARFLKNAYSSVLFLGVENPQNSTSTEHTNEIGLSHEAIIDRLVHSNEGELSLKAQKFEQFEQMSPEQRLQKIQIASKEHIKLENNPQLLARSQLNQYLNLSPIDFNHLKRDCFSDAVCS